MSKLTRGIHIILNRFYVKHKVRSCGKGLRIYGSLHLTHPEYISIGNSFCAGSSLKLETWPVYNKSSTGKKPELIIGNNVSFMDNCQISCLNKVQIEDNVLFGDNVFITDNMHGDSIKSELCFPPIERRLISKGPVIIGKNVWVGRNVCIMPGVTIGENSVIGANSVVTHNVQSYSIVAGTPAKVIKEVR